MTIGSEAYPNPVNRPGPPGRCPPSCSIYCPCGNVLDNYNCPICRCRPSNVCTGRHPNQNSKHRTSYSKSHILY